MRVPGTRRLRAVGQAQPASWLRPCQSGLRRWAGAGAVALRREQRAPGSGPPRQAPWLRRVRPGHAAWATSPLIPPRCQGLRAVSGVLRRDCPLPQNGSELPWCIPGLARLSRGRFGNYLERSAPCSPASIWDALSWIRPSRPNCAPRGQNFSPAQGHPPLRLHEYFPSLLHPAARRYRPQIPATPAAPGAVTKAMMSVIRTETPNRQSSALLPCDTASWRRDPQESTMPASLSRRLISKHLRSGGMAAGSEIGLHADQALLEDVLGRHRQLVWL